MYLAKESVYKIVAAAWLIATVLISFFSVYLTNDWSRPLGLPWIVYISIICQVSLLLLFVFISKTLWRTDEEVNA